MYLKLPVPCVDRSVVYTKRGNRSGLPWGCEHFITNITQNYEYIVIIKSRLTFSPFAAFYLIPCRQYTTYCLHPGKLIPTEPLSLTSSPHPTGREAIAVHSVLCLIFLIHGCGKETLPGAGSHPIVPSQHTRVTHGQAFPCPFILLQYWVAMLWGGVGTCQE